MFNNNSVAARSRAWRPVLRTRWHLLNNYCNNALIALLFLVTIQHDISVLYGESMSHSVTIDKWFCFKYDKRYFWHSRKVNPMFSFFSNFLITLSRIQIVFLQRNIVILDVINRLLVIEMTTFTKKICASYQNTLQFLFTKRNAINLSY